MKKRLVQTSYHSPLGEIVLLAEEEGLCGLWFAEQKYFGSKLLGGQDTVILLTREELFQEIQKNQNEQNQKITVEKKLDQTIQEKPETEKNRAVEVLKETMRWLDCYFAGEAMDVSGISFSFHGSDFQKLIWNMLLEIPYGKTTSYGELARKAAGALGKASMSAQAVGGAVGHNPISILAPCHRVLGAKGNLTGYAGGLEKKRFLLDLEKIAYTDANGTVKKR